MRTDEKEKYYECGFCKDGMIHVSTWIEEDEDGVNVLIRKCNICSHQYRKLEDLWKLPVFTPTDAQISTISLNGVQDKGTMDCPAENKGKWKQQ